MPQSGEVYAPACAWSKSARFCVIAVLCRLGNSGGYGELSVETVVLISSDCISDLDQINKCFVFPAADNCRGWRTQAVVRVSS